ncbi:thioredoxin family protein [Phytoactinopolyspora halotolerans]|uniref:Thioredoxin family protein n=1 Tax=Phytoactinopolyspora halotolerans TaxID=1981512 RepID=A0A6L9S1W9_9ACTN|nr:thioredoxin family protein [Phytoactinopolyspora halotolerans]NED99215.1 thioredoxin family protein [Phytoactinopolyspora halotolerans]
MIQIIKTDMRVRRALTAVALVSGMALTACGDDDAAPAGDDSGAVASQESSPEPMEDAEETSDSDEMEDESTSDDATDDQMDDDAGDDEMDDDADVSDQEGDDSGQAELAAGTYREYSEDAVADAGFDTTILFFHASWCPECRAFEESIEAGPIPDGVQILKVDYDSESELKQRYDVTIQTTFVRVDENGEQLGTWVGYEQDRSVDTILNELG